MPTVPTKGNLIAKKRSLTLAKTGFDLMDRKRNILIREMMSLINAAEEIQSQIDTTFSEAYRSLRKANITLGIIDDIAASVPVDNSVEIHYRSIMGVEIPSVTRNNEPPRIYYGFQDTNSALDDAFVKFHRVKNLCRILSEIENTIYLLANSIKKTQKRANALDHIIIPEFSKDIKFITESLDEKDREDFSRLKVIKRRNTD
jgi:V/A-type H+-transporting ATPase subunit D